MNTFDNPYLVLILLAVLLVVAIFGLMRSSANSERLDQRRRTDSGQGSRVGGNYGSITPRPAE